MSVLVTGGAGYIGSHAVNQLLDAGRDVVVVDNLSRGNRTAVPKGAHFYQCDLANTSELISILKQHEVTEVIHFAALAYVEESLSDPLLYYRNNVAGTVSLLDAMNAAEVRRLVFSSTCATYGQPESLPATEETPQHPINPYGQSKLMVERILQDTVATGTGWAVTVFRYFNVAGSVPDGSMGEDHVPQTRLIPLVLQTALGQRSHITIFGDDYDTPDGTCIRDYIHVEDLCAAHLLALEHLVPNEIEFFNLGIGKGFSVQEVIESARRVTGKEIPLVKEQRRAGDPPALFADSSKIRNQLGWQPEYEDLDEIIRTAWNWFQNHPTGY